MLAQVSNINNYENNRIPINAYLSQEMLEFMLFFSPALQPQEALIDCGFS